MGCFEVPSNRIDTLCYELTGVLEEEIKAGTNFKREQQSKSIKGDKGEGKKSECVKEDVEDQEMNDGPIAANSAGDHRLEERKDDADGADGTAGAESNANALHSEDNSLVHVSAPASDLSSSAPAPAPEPSHTDEGEDREDEGSKKSDGRTEAKFDTELPDLKHCTCPNGHAMVCMWSRAPLNG